MKHRLLKVLICVCLFCLSGCAVSGFSRTATGTGLRIPKGYISKEEHFDKQGFLDYTDYCKYRYENSAPVKNDTWFAPISEAEIENVRGYFDDLRMWMELEDRLDEYDFDPGCISAGDYVHLSSKEGKQIDNGSSVYSKYDNYSLYFFDTESCTLYYIHSNI